MQSEKKRCPKYQYNYKKLRGRIKEYYDTQEKFADELGIGRVSLSQRLNNKLEFRQDEIKLAAELLEIQVERIAYYFFDTGGA